jgi:hypothetical protein
MENADLFLILAPHHGVFPGYSCIKMLYGVVRCSSLSNSELHLATNAPNAVWGGPTYKKTHEPWLVPVLRTPQLARMPLLTIQGAWINNACNEATSCTQLPSDALAVHAACRCARLPLVSPSPNSIGSDSRINQRNALKMLCDVISVVVKLMVRRRTPLSSAAPFRC